MQAKTEIFEKQRVSDFLNVVIPKNFIHLFDNSFNTNSIENLDCYDDQKSGDTEKARVSKYYRELNIEDIQNIYPEREPGLKILKAIVFEVANEHLILARFTVTHEMCAGHMPGYPILPLAEAGRALAQVGAILISYTVKHKEKREGNFTPLVYKVGELVSGQRGFLYPGDNILVVAKSKKLRGPLYSVEAQGYLKEDHIFSMPKIQYFVTEEQRFWNGNNTLSEKTTNKSVFLIYWFRIRSEKMRDFNEWAIAKGMPFWQSKKDILKYQTFRPASNSLNQNQINGNLSDLNGVSQVEAKSEAAIHEVLSSNEFLNLQEEFLTFLVPNSLHYSFMNSAYSS